MTCLSSQVSASRILRVVLLDRLLSGVSAEEFGLSADIISGSLGPTSLVSDNAMFSSATAAPLPVPPIGLGLSDSPSMSAYISTGSPGSDSTTNSQLVWKQSANLPDPDLLKHLCEITLPPHTSAPELTFLSQGRGLLRLPSPRKSAFTPIHIPFVGAFFSLHGEVKLIHAVYSNFSLPQTHPKYPRAALLHAICAVSSAYSPAVSNPHLYGTQGNAKGRPLSCASGFLTIGFVFR